MVISWRMTVIWDLFVISCTLSGAPAFNFLALQVDNIALRSHTLPTLLHLEIVPYMFHFLRFWMWIVSTKSHRSHGVRDCRVWHWTKLLSDAEPKYQNNAND